VTDEFVLSLPDIEDAPVVASEPEPASHDDTHATGDLPDDPAAVAAKPTDPEPKP